MERTVPSTASEEVELYLRTYYSLLRSTAVVQIRTLEEAHAGMKSLLHPGARLSKPDMSAFIYSLLRMPICMTKVRLVVLGQSVEVFTQNGYPIEQGWTQVSPPARRRRCFFDGEDTLVCLIASRSDIDDIIPVMTAFQIEWNKLHGLLAHVSESFISGAWNGGERKRRELVDVMEIDIDDLTRLRSVWGSEMEANLVEIKRHPCSLGVRLLNGSLSDYRRATHSWWENIEARFPEIRHRPVYFVSSNTHSIVNLLTGFALRKKEELIAYVEEQRDPLLLEEWKAIKESHVPSSLENFLYYVLRKYQNNPEGAILVREQLEYDEGAGVLNIPSEHYFDVEAQVIDLACLDPGGMDPRLFESGLSDCPQFLPESKALILNIDYPLGLAAYNILAEVGEHVASIPGVYVMGKAATLNGVVGDVMISNVVHDEHSQNTYIFPNCFTAADVTPYLTYGTVLDNQKSVSVQGTFLQNANYMEVFYREGYTDIEMEAGPYLSAVYEMYRPKRHPVNEIVNLYGLPFDLGIVHYASDTPLSKGKNLGAGSLSYNGMDSTYAATLAILRRILCMEKTRALSRTE